MRRSRSSEEDQPLRKRSNKHPAPRQLAEILKLVNLVDQANPLPDLRAKLQPLGEATEEWVQEGETLLNDLQCDPEIIASVLSAGDRALLNDAQCGPEIIASIRSAGAEIVHADTGIDRPLRRFNRVCLMLERYDFIRTSCERLRALARYGGTGLVIAPATPRLYLRDPQRRYQAARDSFDEFIMGFGGIEADYLKECPICQTIFWAGRTDQQGCTPGHSASNRVRKHRKGQKGHKTPTAS
jgi:hypothetical protein